MISLTPAPGGLALRTPFDRTFVDQFKQAIPSSGRRWDAAARLWVVAPQYGQTVANLCNQWFGVVVNVPTASVAAVTETRLLRVEYIGACKGNESLANAMVDGQWGAIFPEAVLRTWFDDRSAPGVAASLFAVLMIPQTATPEEIKTGFRNMAKRWHPDVCREPDAHEMSKRINHAYAVLSDPIRRRKYLAGLAMEASATVRPNPLLANRNYRSPVRCGWIMADGQESLGRFLVSQIHLWNDIVSPRGEVMVTSWPMGATTFETSWV